VILTSVIDYHETDSFVLFSAERWMLRCPQFLQGLQETNRQQCLAEVRPYFCSARNTFRVSLLSAESNGNSLKVIRYLNCSGQIYSFGNVY